jgi:hypothetical protein
MKTTAGHFFSLHVNYTVYICAAGNFKPAEQRHNLAQEKQRGTHQVLEACFPGIMNKGHNATIKFS